MMAPCDGGNRGNSITPSTPPGTGPRRLSLFVLVLALGVLGSSFRLKAEANGFDPAQFTSGVSAVEVYASVIDASGQPVRGLQLEDFEVLEDGAPQTISAFTAGDFPLTVALALDHSFSMAGPPLAAVKRAARNFLGALRAEDEVFVVGISSRVEVVAKAGSPRPQQIAAVDALSAWGTTTLHDSILAAIDTVDGSRGRRALVILSDGDDRYSEASAADAIARARRSNVIVYPIALGKLRPPLFAELSTLTGGRSYHARDLKGLDETLAGIAAQLREQYLLGYSPSRVPLPGANEWRSISVRVKKPGVSVRARDGYYVR